MLVFFCRSNEGVFFVASLTGSRDLVGFDDSLV